MSLALLIDPFWEQTAGNFCFGLLWFLLECAREEELAGLFCDECMGMPDEETETPEENEEEITDAELEKRFDELFNITE